ncbi:MAG: hypothetical protein AAF466_06260 [Bacteroidota bacterium]
MKTQETTSHNELISEQTKDQYSRAIREAIEMQLASIRYSCGESE